MKNKLKYLSYYILFLALYKIPDLNDQIARGRSMLWAESDRTNKIMNTPLGQFVAPHLHYRVTETLSLFVEREDWHDFSHYKNVPVVSVWVDPEEFYDKDRGNFANPNKRGILWERASYFTYYEEGQRKFSSFAGVRMHGGAARDEPIKSFRFHFREHYGAPSFYDTGLKKILLRRENVPFANDFSYSLIKRLGGYAPEIKYVVTYLNGDFYKHLHLVEHLTRKYFKNLLGHDQFYFIKLRGNSPYHDRLPYELLIEKVQLYKGERLFTFVEENFDLDSLIPWYLTVAYLGTSDWGQGVWFKDKREPHSKWKLFAWDFDHAFTNELDRTKEPWEISGLSALYDDDPTLQAKLFQSYFSYPENFNKLKQHLPAFCEEVEAHFEVKIKEYEKLGILPEGLEHLKTFREKRGCLEILN